MRHLFRKTLSNIRNNKAATASVIGGLTFIALLVLAACLHSKPVSSDLLGVSIVDAVGSLALCVAVYHRKGNDWHTMHQARYDIPRWSFSWLFAASSHRDI